MIHVPMAAARPDAAMTNARWVEYFEANRDREAALPWDAPLNLPAPMRIPLVRTLQRFHLGESGEGAYLKRWAKAIGDPDYCRAIDLFVAEEQAHSRWFGLLLERLDTPPLSGHWSDTAFTLVRHAGGLPFELMTFLVAEIIGKRFFAALARNLNCPLASAVCRQVVRDEAAHIAFHIGTLQSGFAGQGVLKRRIFKAVWKAILRIGLEIVCHDHATLLRQLGVSRRQLKRDCGFLFEDVVRRIYDPTRETHLDALPDKAGTVVLDVLKCAQVSASSTSRGRRGALGG